MWVVEDAAGGEVGQWAVYREHAWVLAVSFGVNWTDVAGAVLEYIASFALIDRRDIAILNQLLTAGPPYRWVGIPDCTRPNVYEPTSTGFPGGR